MYLDIKDSISVTMSGKVLHKTGKWHNGRTLPNHLLVYCTDGAVEFQMTDRTVRAEKGDLIFIPKDTFYKPVSEGQCEYYFFHFKARTLSGFDVPYPVGSRSAVSEGEAGFIYDYSEPEHEAVRLKVLFRSVGDDVKELIMRCATLDPSLRFDHKLLLDAYIREMLILLSTDDKSIAVSGRLREICDYINIHYSQPIGLSSLAVKFSLDRSYIARMFRKELGKKPSEYINERRISCACRLLCFSDMSISEVAEASGFSSVYYFSRLFGKYKGVSPSRFRQLNRHYPV